MPKAVVFVVEHVTDNKGLYNTFNSGPAAGALSSNCDLYTEIFETTEDKAIRVKVRWMPSHLDENGNKVIPSGVEVSSLDIAGNKQADVLAAIAAKRHAVSLNVSAGVLYYKSLVKRIQNILATILLNLPDRKHKNAKPFPKQGIALQDLLSSTLHVINEEEISPRSPFGRVSCARCHSSFKRNDPNLKHWLTCRCRDLGTGSDRPVPIPYEELHMGNRVTHYSHSLYRYRGLVYCNKCGAWSAEQLWGLSAPCEPPRDHGRAALKAIRNGKRPHNLDRWPDT